MKRADATGTNADSYPSASHSPRALATDAVKATPSGTLSTTVTASVRLSSITTPAVGTAHANQKRTAEAKYGIAERPSARTEPEASTTMKPAVTRKAATSA